MSRCISAAEAGAGAGAANILTCMESTSQTSTSSSSTTTLDAAALVDGKSNIAIAWQYDDSMQETGSHFHWAVRSFSDSNGDFCSGDPDTVNDSSLNLSNLPNVPFPPNFKFSDMISARGSSLSKWPCTYEGSSDNPGKISCTGWKNVTCTNDLKSANSKIDCGEGVHGGDITYVPKVICAFSDSDKEF
ncbi:uncharacterized protein N7459_006615 [Penicillium hispanicum]|uniref:uncharacterized protein n=1 Tax=Penicillium hispanicum TaxID=1080232 RepID=UPI00253F97DA|nr:uncharacterized protein N7459_006615 [Penicillium hispanicum]KAJ5577651.1 hypothetical protein N7459_006615 [Penicillium hispanicum]